MSGKEGSGPPAQVVPVDLATKTPTVAQIRIPSVPAGLRPALVTRPGLAASPKPGASITVIPKVEIIMLLSAQVEHGIAVLIIYYFVA